MRIPDRPPPIEQLVESAESKKLFELISSAIGSIPKDRYLHWDALRHRQPPPGYSLHEWWLAKKLSRSSNRQLLPLEDTQDIPFSFYDHGALHQKLQQIDSDATGHIEAPSEDIASAGTRERYIIRSVIEEAITSSQLEGAATTREVAKELIRSGRSPRDTSEQMILNNYKTMLFIREHKGEDLSTHMLLKIQELVTENTLTNPNEVGRFRLPNEKVEVVDIENNVLHTPPDAKLLPQRIDRLITFANASNEQPFVHPVLKAIILHFMIGYEHPFVDGNGRTARALFYWSMARSNYWLIEFISISSLIRKSAVSYARAYLYTETDDNDVTYFLDYNLRIIRRCIDALHKYLANKVRETKRLEQMFLTGGLAHVLNHRQKDLLAHLVKRPESVYAIEGHRHAHGVTYVTARKDIKGLVDFGFLDSATAGRKHVFRMSPNFSENLATLSDFAN